jgi:hypothetical protein
MNSNDDYDFTDATIQDVANTMFRRISGYDERQRQSRILTIILTCSVTLDLALTIVLGFVVANLHDQQQQLRHQQAATHQSQLTACNLGNQFRHGQLTVWEEFLHLATTNPTVKLTPAQQHHQHELITQFQAFLHNQYREVNCAKLYPRP